MPEFEITAPDGQRFVITAPEGASQEQVLQYAQQNRPAPLPLPPQAPPPDPASTSTLGTLARGAVRGLTLGFNDELGGLTSGVAGLFTGEGFTPAYERTRDEIRAQDTADQTHHPIANFGGQVAGGVGGALAAAPVSAAAGLTALGTRAVAPLASRVNALLGPRIGGTVNTAGRMLANGAAQGGMAGFGEGQGGVDARVENAGQGAALGGGAGLVLGGGVRAGAGLLGRLGHGLGIRNPEVAADRQILRSLDRADVPLATAEARLAAGGDAPLALVDVGGRNTAALGGVAANTPSRAMDVADEFVQGRRLGRPDRLTNAGDEAFGGGSGGDIATVTAERQAQRSAEARPRYESAFNRISPDEDAARLLTPAVEDPIGQRALQNGLRVIELENTAARLRDPSTPIFDPAQYGVARGEDGQFVLTDGFRNMRLYDAVKRGFDDIVESYRDGTTNRLNLDQYGRAVDQARHAYTGQLRELYPRYASALDAWAGPSAQMEATAAGRTALRTDRDVVAQRMQGPPDVQDAYRLGAGRDFADRVSDPGRASGAARLMSEDGQMQSRLNSLLPAEARDQLNTVLRRENEMTGVERTVSPRAGSQTGRLLAGGEDMGNDPLGPWATSLLQLTTGHPIAAAGTVARDQFRRFGQGINPATSDALANRLFATNPEARAAIIQALQSRRDNDLISAARALRIERPALRGLGAAAGLTAD